MSKEPIKTPTTRQYLILHELYRFRFLTTAQLVKLLHTNSKIKMNERLTTLLNQGYIGRRYEPSYKLIHKHASYFPLKDGLSALKQSNHTTYSAKALYNARKDPGATDKFIERCISVCEVAIGIGNDETRVFTKSEITNYDYFPEKRPDLYIRQKMKNGEQHYLLEYIESKMPLHAILKLLKRYISYCDDGEWEVTNTPFPRVLLVCETPELERRLQKYTLTTIEEADDELLKFYTTTSEKLKSKTSRTWTRLGDEDDGSGDYGRVEDEFIMPASGA